MEADGRKEEKRELETLKKDTELKNTEVYERFLG